MNTALQKEIGAALWVQIAWALLSALWNVAGVTLLAWGQPALGPTASLGGAVILIGVAAALWHAIERWPLVYALLTAAAGLLALSAVVNALTGDRALWSSEFWRLAGAALNSAGFVAAAFATYRLVRRSHLISDRHRINPK